MNLTNRIKRLSSLIVLLSKGQKLSTPDVVNRFGVSKKVIQTDFKDYLIPLFFDNKIFYDYSEKVYKASNNFLTKTLFSADELAVIAILKFKAKDKHTDEDLFDKADALFHRFEDELSNKIYQKSSVEKFDEFKDEIIQIRNAIETKNIIKCFYNEKYREIYPLKILNLEGYWYLIIYEPTDKKIKTYHLNTIKEIDVLHSNFLFDNEKIESFDSAITAYYKPENLAINVQLYIRSKVARYFIRKPLSKAQRILRENEDKSIEIEIYITDYMEIIPTIQRYMPYISVIEPEELKNKIKKNIDEYLKFNE
ncbi:MAG: WYL domain-containing protein [Aliarcobacter sp.]|nr:WYL domain-containing protein [Aliarcobacter sp.]